MIYVLCFCAMVILVAGLKYNFGDDLSICRISFAVFILGDVVRRANEK